jgi:hypothetical protein
LDGLKSPAHIDELDRVIAHHESLNIWISHIVHALWIITTDKQFSFATSIVTSTGAFRWTVTQKTGPSLLRSKSNGIMFDDLSHENLLWVGTFYCKGTALPIIISGVFSRHFDHSLTNDISTKCDFSLNRRAKNLLFEVR